MIFFSFLCFLMHILCKCNIIFQYESCSICRSGKSLIIWLYLMLAIKTNSFGQWQKHYFINASLVVWSLLISNFDVLCQMHYSFLPTHKYWIPAHLIFALRASIELISQITANGSWKWKYHRAQMACLAFVAPGR